MVFTQLWRRKLIFARVNNEGPSGGADQRQVLAFLCRTHGLAHVADEYLAKTHEASYWSEADRLAEVAVTSGNAEQLVLTERVLLSLVEYSSMAVASRAIVYYNLALIARARKNAESVNRYLDLAKNDCPIDIEKRLRVDPRFS